MKSGRSVRGTRVLRTGTLSSEALRAETDGHLEGRGGSLSASLWDGRIRKMGDRGDREKGNAYASDVATKASRKLLVLLIVVKTM